MSATSEPYADLTDEEFFERTSDAIHIANPLRPELTLCGFPVRRTLNVETFAPDMRVDHWAGCWTCNDEAWRLAWAGKVGEAA